MMNKRSGLTYVELIITVAIIAILAAIAVPNFLEAQQRTVVAKSKANLSTLHLAIEAYRVDYRAYPPNAVPGQASPYDLLVITTPVAYLTRLPLDAMLERKSELTDDPEMIELLPYNYFNGLQLDEDGVVFQQTDFNSPSGYVAAIIWGEGTIELANERYYYNSWDGEKPPKTRVLESGEFAVYRYDPTNGTTSPGQIYDLLP